MKKFYGAPEAQLLQFQTEESIAADGDDLVQGTANYDNVVDFDDLLKPKGW